MPALEKPNYTQVPNSLFDAMPFMGDAELRCTLALVRKIIGYHKAVDPVSYSQLMEATGLSRQGVRNGLQAAIERGMVCVVGSGKQGIKRYTLNFVGDESELVNAVDQSTTLTKTSLPRRHTKEKKKEADPNGSEVQPDKPKRKRKPNTIPATQMNPMKDTLVQEFGWDTETMNSNEWGIIQRAAKLLCESQVNPTEVPSLRAYCEKTLSEYGPMALTTNVQKWRASADYRALITSRTPSPGPTVDQDARAILLPGRGS